jgi:tetratricopeptide (TPR) repeat protein
MRAVAGLVAAAAAAVSFTLAGAAHAQTRPGGDEVTEPEPEVRRVGGYLGRDLVRLEIDDCPTAPDVGRQHLQDIAAEHYDRGRVLYKQGDYPGAVHEFVSAYCLFPATYTLLADIGQAYERSLDYARAVGYLERYVLAIPDNARRASPCDPDPLEDKRNVSARIQVLQNLPASIQVATNPPGATVTLTGDAGVRAQEKANARTIEVVAGRYAMTIELAGYEPVTREIEPDIGKPYSYYFELAPRRGRLSIQVVPGDARLFLDDRLIGLGGFDDELASGTYELVVEASGRLPERRRVDVVAGRDTRIAVRLAEPPASGRTQLVFASALAGATAGAAGLGVGFKESGGAIIGGAIGLGVGGLGGWLGVPRDVPVGLSSLIITGALAGAVQVGSSSELATDEDSATVASALAGAVLGGATATLVGSRIDISAGDAALINSGALWGTATGALFVAVFEYDDEIENALLIAGLDVGLVSGALLASRYEWSRGHAALIDLAGLGGAAIGVAVESGLDAVGETSGNERVAHYALAGMTLGLIAGGVLTRNMDVPKLRVTPSAGSAKTAQGDTVTTFGLTGNF